VISFCKSERGFSTFRLLIISVVRLPSMAKGWFMCLKEDGSVMVKALRYKPEGR
jgi:hypothetical protein